MRYRNKITGLVINTNCNISGANFELLDAPAPAVKEVPKEKAVKETKPKTTTTAKRAKK